MTIPRISSLLIMLTLGHDALALQMGQITSESVRGQPLMARVTLYGMPADTDGNMAAELFPAFGSLPDSLAKFDVQARIETNAFGGRAIVITSARPFDAANLSVRVRLREGTQAMVRHFELDIPAAPTARIERPTRARHATPARRASREVTSSNDAPAAAPTWNATDDYGPVRAGQSLWGILKETGLAGGDSRSLRQQIVAANPKAFVGGDATRLRVGVTLHLPHGQSVGRATSKASDSGASRVSKQAVDADTAARLERLATQFTEIRARYAAQKQPTKSATPTHAQAPVAALSTLDGKAAPDKAIAPNTAVPPAKKAANVIAPVPSVEREKWVDTVARVADGKMLMGLGAALLMVALAFGGMRFGRRLRGRMADAGVHTADRERVAEIARKTEKRVQLEDEVKRMLAGRREGTDERAQGTLRPADLLAGVRGSLEEIETRIAHGQYNEAEAMLEQTIVDAPNNHRAKLRLAEIYYLNERHEEFVDLADEIYRQHRSDIGDENWARLMRMGKVIAPDRPPFSGPVAVEVGRRAH